VRGEVTVVSQGGAANRYASGRKITFERISGHRDGDATSCPGDALYAQLDDLRERVADLAEAISALSIRVEENRLQYPETAVALTGLLRFDDGGVPTGQPIQLQFRSGGGDWTAVQDVSAAPDGSFAAALTAPASGRLRAVYGGDGVHPPLESAPVRIRLQPEITIDVFPRRIKLGRRTAVSGTVTPAEFADVAVLVQRRVGGIFYKTSRHRVAVVDGAFKTRLSLPRKGFYRVTVSAGGGSAATTCRCA
jgi:hypothetical protein